MTTSEFRHRMQGWQTAETPTYTFIQKQLLMCQKNSISGLLCDLPDIGKTYAALAYAVSKSNTVYVDCSQVKSKQRLIRFIAGEFGVNNAGKYSEVYQRLVNYLKTAQKPLVILDEAGDLAYDAFLELKALWNATERACGWFMMGADGLQEKMNRAIDNKKVGYTEIFSRYGKRYQRVTPLGSEEAVKFFRIQAALIIKANASKDVDIQSVLLNTEGSLRRINNELSK
jgi:DNA transposition AAA+ family ATPase